VIGPVGRSESQLDRALDLAFGSLLADRALYLGPADLVTRRRRRSVPEEGNESLWRRSLGCLDKGAQALDRFVAAERKRLEWAKLELPDNGGKWIALSESRLLLVCREQRGPGSEGSPAELVVEGSEAGSSFEFLPANPGNLRLFPGSLDQAGLAVVSDGTELSVEVYDLVGTRLARQVVTHSNS
jgi:hypothetical protein